MRRALLACLPLLLVAPADAEVHGNFAAPAAVSVAPAAVSATLTVALSPSALPAGALVGHAPGPATGTASSTRLAPMLSIGTATVFVRAQTLTPAVAAHLRAIRQVPRLVSTFYLADDATNGRLALDNQHVTLQGLELALDPGNQLATRNGVSPGTIVFRDGLGAIRHYDLITDYPSFMAQVHFIGGGR